MEQNNNAEAQREVPEVKEVVREIHHHHYKKSFNFGGLFFGIILICVGFLYLAKNTGWITFDANVNWLALWPLLLIVLGLSMLSRGGWVMAIIGGLITLVVVSLVALVIVGGLNGPGWPKNINIPCIQISR